VLGLAALAAVVRADSFNVTMRDGVQLSTDVNFPDCKDAGSGGRQ